MLQVFVTCDALQFVLDNQLDILLDLVVIVQNSLLHAVVAIGILEVVDDGDRLIMAFLSLYLIGVNDNLGMEDLLLYALGEVVGNRSNILSSNRVDRLTEYSFSMSLVSCMKLSFSLLKTSSMRLCFKSLLIQSPPINRQI